MEYFHLVKWLDLYIRFIDNENFLTMFYINQRVW